MSGIKASTISSAILALEEARQALIQRDKEFFETPLYSQMVDAKVGLKVELECSAVQVPVQGAA